MTTETKVEAVAWRFVRHGKELGFWCDPKVNGLPPPAESMSAEFSVEFAYPQSALDALRGEVERLENLCLALEAQAEENFSKYAESNCRVAELTGLLSDTAGNLRRMANDEFADCDQVRLEHVVNRIEHSLTKESP